MTESLVVATMVQVETQLGTLPVDVEASGMLQMQKIIRGEEIPEALQIVMKGRRAGRLSQCQPIRSLFRPPLGSLKSCLIYCRDAIL
jgi:hypothetical protein